MSSDEQGSRALHGRARGALDGFFGIAPRLSALALAAALTACGGGGGGTPGTGGSPSVGFAVAGPVVFPGATLDVVSDESRQLLYLSLPSMAGPNGNAVVALDPRTNTVVRSQFVGSEPGALSMSSDGAYLYVAVNGGGSVKRLTLPGLVPDLDISLGSGSFGGPYHAVALEAVPGSPRSFVVSTSYSTVPEMVTLTRVFDDAVARDHVLTDRDCYCSSLQFGDTPSQLYAGDAESSGYNFYTLTVDASGVSLVTDVLNAFDSFFSRIHYSRDNHLIYDDDGTVFDPVAGKRLANTGVRGPMLPDVAHGRLYYATSVGSFALSAYDANTFASVGTPRPFPVGNGYPGRLVRWGSNGIAMSAGLGGTLIFGGDGTSTFSTATPAGTSSQLLIAGTFLKMIWDPVTARLYATTASATTSATAFGVSANSVLAIDPASGTITAARHFLAAPNALAVSGDGQFLYVGLDDAGMVQRLKLPSLDLDISLPLGSNSRFGPYYAGDIAVSPGSPRTVAVTQLSAGVVPAEQGGMVLFDDAVQRPVTAPEFDIAANIYRYHKQVAWSLDGSRLYSTNTLSSLYVSTVDGAGIHAEHDYNAAFPSPGRLHVDSLSGLVHHDSGRLVDPATGLPRGVYRMTGNIGAEWVSVDASAGLVWVATNTLASYGPNFRIDAFDRSRYTSTATYPLTIASGFPFDFVQWSSKGFAYRSPDGIGLVQLSATP